MNLPTSHNSLAANSGTRRVTIGWDDLDELRRLSDARLLTCPGCRAPVVLRAGTVRAAHFAHLPGAVCSLPQTEPETEEHRAGKLLIARWLRERLPDMEIIVEAFVPETGQRADVMLVTQEPRPRRIAFEYQCANLSAREWRRRNRLYRASGIADLWLLGGSRWHIRGSEQRGERVREPDAEQERQERELRTTELERALLWDNAPLLFLDALGYSFAAETLVRFRPASDTQALAPSGKTTCRPLLSLAFPWPLLDWPHSTHPDAPLLREKAEEKRRHEDSSRLSPRSSLSDWWLWEWLGQRFRVTPDSLDGFFGVEIGGQEAFACTTRVWQAAIYYRFVHRRVGDGWWLPEVLTWARAYLPLARPVPAHKLEKALEDYQELLAAAGFLSLPVGYNRTSARVLSDLTTLAAPPDIQEAVKIARYRRTLARDARAAYSI